MDEKPKQRINAELIYFQLTQINSRLDKFEQVFVTKTESEALKIEIKNLRDDVQELKETTTDEIERLKGRKQLRDTILWMGLTASSIINIIALYNVFTRR